MKWNPFNTRVGIALGGGAAKGIAHIGVLKAVEEEGINVSCIAGTSIGALVASYYAFGKHIDEIKQIGDSMKFSTIANLSLQKKGLFSTRSTEAMIIRDLGNVNIEQARIPLAICATDIHSGKKVILRTGNLAKAVCASMAIPGIFAPVEINGRLLADGGLTENVPISALDQMGAGITIAIDLNGVEQYAEPKDMVTIISNAIDIAINQRTREQLRQADVTLSLNLGHFSRLGNSAEYEALYQTGYQSAKQKINRLLWYRRTRFFFYLKMLLNYIAPIKIPLVLRALKKRLRQRT